MPIVLGTAKPDCDYKDPKSIVITSKEGCPRQAQFKLWIENVQDGAYKDKPIHACRSHAGILFKMLRDMAKEMRRLKDRVIVKVLDLDHADPSKKTVRVLVQREDKGRDVRKLNNFLAKRRS